MTLLQHAESVLKNTGRPLTSQELVAGYKPPKGGKTPHESLRVAVTRKDTVIKKIGNKYCLKGREQELKHKEISDLAYSLWEKAGKPISNGVEFWLQAESVLTNKWNRL